MFENEGVIGISVIGGLLVIDEDDMIEVVSVICDHVLLKGVTGVTMRV